MKNRLFLLMLTFLPLVTLAQPGQGTDPNEGAVPITGGLLYLLLAGGMLGIKQFVKKYRK